jgi:hypothetical protein
LANFVNKKRKRVQTFTSFFSAAVEFIRRTGRKILPRTDNTATVSHHGGTAELTQIACGDSLLLFRK